MGIFALSEMTVTTSRLFIYSSYVDRLVNGIIEAIQNSKQFILLRKQQNYIGIINESISKFDFVFNHQQFSVNVDQQFKR